MKISDPLLISYFGYFKMFWEPALGQVIQNVLKQISPKATNQLPS